MTDPAELWHHHHNQWRDPMQVASSWEAATSQERQLFKFKVTGQWWETLAASDVTLLVSREYEHLLMALTVCQDQPYITYLKLPHPSGLAFDLSARVVYIASTRNPNQIMDLKPVVGLIPR